MLESLFAMFKKNFLMFFRSKISAIIILLIPLIIVLAAGFAFNSSGLSNVHVGVSSNTSSNLTQKIISGFKENGFLVKDYSSKIDCMNAVKTNEVQICSFFSKDASKNSSRDSVEFYVDYSKINLADALVNNVENTVHNESVTTGKFFVQDLINLIDSAKTNLPKSKTEFESVSSQIYQNSNSIRGITVPVSQFDTAINYIKSAKSSSNSSDVTSSLDDALNILSTIKSSNQQISSVIKNLHSSQDGISQEINSGIANLTQVISNIQSQNITSAENIISPIKTSVKPLNSNTNSRNYLIPILIALIALFGSILLSSTFVLKEKKTLAHFRNFMTPTKEMVFIFAIFLTCLAILVFQFLLVFLGMRYIIGMQIPITLELVVALFLALSAFIFIGTFIGYAFRSEESVIFASMTAASAFLFFSNIILPLESLSGGLIGWSFLNPLILLDSSLKKVLLFNLGFSFISFELIALGIFAVVFGILTYFARRITRRMI